jgi:hypothetical protein
MDKISKHLPSKSNTYATLSALLETSGHDHAPACLNLDNKNPGYPLNGKQGTEQFPVGN